MFAVFKGCCKEVILTPFLEPEPFSEFSYGEREVACGNVCLADRLQLLLERFLVE